MKVTYLNNVYDKDTKTEQLTNILNWIKNGRYQDEIEKIRLLDQSSKSKDKTESKKIKSSLPVFFPSIVLRDRKEMNGAEEVSGIVHFDIDLDHNEGMDVEAVLKNITSHPSTIYTFLSPRGGIKFGVLTDFERGFLEDMDVTRSRYPEAYARTKAHILELVDVVFDDMNSIKSSCHVSYDPNLYYNPNAVKLALGKIDAMPELEVAEPSGTVDEKYIYELLSYVDPNLSYSEMRAVAFCVFYYLKEAGLPILLCHFHDKHGDLKRKLTDLMKGTKRAYLSALEAQARKGGWKPKTGKGRKVETNKPSTHRFPATMAPEEAARKIAEIIRDCIKDQRSHYICLTCGC